MTPNVPLIAWQPDADPTIPGVVTEVVNLLPTVRGYAPDGAESVSTLYPMTMPSGGYYEGAECLYFPGGQVLTFVGSDRKLYLLDNGQPAPIDVSRLGAPYAGGVFGWAFAQYKELALAANGGNPLQAMSVLINRFSDVAGSPGGGTVAVNRNFVMLAQFAGAATPTYPFADGWWCSAQENHADWSPDIATQCARGRLTATSGAIVRLFAYRDSILAFKANSMYRGEYVGPTNNTWAFPLISKSIGLVGHNAICEAENRVYWLGPDGFYVYDGSAPARINSAPWNYLTETCGPFFFNAEICARWDRARRVVRFYMSRADTGAAFGVAYHPDTDRWGLFTTNAYCAFPVRYEDVVTPWTTGTDRYFFALATIDRTTNQIKVVSGGTPGASSFTTGDVGDDDQVIAMMRGRTRFLRAPATATMTHYYRMDLGDALTTGETATRNSGKYDVGHAARWHRMKFAQTGMHEVTGFSVGPQMAGKR